MTYRNGYDPDENFPTDWEAWRKVWDAWKADHAGVLGGSSYRWPAKNFMADEVLGRWSINHRNVELSEVTFPDLSGQRRGETVRYVGITFGTAAGTDTPENGLVRTFTDLERELGIFECMNCGAVRTVEGWRGCQDVLGASCEKGN